MYFLGPRVLVPGSRLWLARAVHSRRSGRPAIRARHLLFPWQTITVDTADLRYGYEAVGRYLAGGYPGFQLTDSRWWRRPSGRTAPQS
jgi:hypothetical protein